MHCSDELQSLNMWEAEWAVYGGWKVISLKIDNYLKSVIQQIGESDRFIMQNPPIFSLFFPYLTFLEEEIELQCEDDCGITNLERSNGFHMLIEGLN